MEMPRRQVHILSLDIQVWGCNMKYNKDLQIGLKRMKKFFVDELGFESIEGNDLYKDNTIECELYLINKQNNTKIFITKHFDDDEINFTMSGRPEIANEYNKYISYYLKSKNNLNTKKD